MEKDIGLMQTETALRPTARTLAPEVELPTTDCRRFQLTLPPVWLLLFVPMAAVASILWEIGWMLRKPDNPDQGADPMD